MVNTSQQEKVKKVKLYVEVHTSYPLGDTGIMERAFIEARERTIKILESYDGRKFLNFDDAVRGAKRARVGIIRVFQEYAKKIEEDWYHNPTAVITTYEGYPNDEEYDVGAVLAAVSNGIEIYMFTAGFTINLKDYSLDPWAEFSWITATKGRDGLEIVRLNKLKTSLKRLVKIIAEKLYLDWLCPVSPHLASASHIIFSAAYALGTKPSLSGHHESVFPRGREPVCSQLPRTRG